jgi:hypothetical protein
MGQLRCALLCVIHTDRYCTHSQRLFDTQQSRIAAGCAGGRRPHGEPHISCQLLPTSNVLSSLQLEYFIKPAAAQCVVLLKHLHEGSCTHSCHTVTTALDIFQTWLKQTQRVQLLAATTFQTAASWIHPVQVLHYCSVRSPFQLLSCSGILPAAVRVTPGWECWLQPVTYRHCISRVCLLRC